MTWEEFLKEITPIEQELVKKYLDILIETMPESIVEIGTGWGLFSRTAIEYFLQTDQQIRLTTIDKLEKRELFDKHIKGYEDQVIRIIGDSADVLPELRKNGTYDFIFIDGDHGYKGFTMDLELCRQLSPKNILCDDVFHRHNYDFTGDYGIMKSLSEVFLKEKETKSIFYNVGNGLALLRYEK